MWWIYPVYVVDLALMVFLSFQLGNLIDLLDKKTKISGALLGGVLLACVTSLPELFTSLSSIFLVHNASYVVGDILGSIIFDLLVLLVATFVWFKHFPDAKFQRWHVWNGVICLGMYALAAYAFFAPANWQVMLGDINLVSILIMGLYVASLLLQPKEKTEEEEKETATSENQWSVAKILWLFAGCSIVLIASSIALTYLTHLIEENDPTGFFSGSVAGALLLGIGTSIPEVISTAQLFHKRNYDAGFGNMIGSCTFDWSILVFGDFISWHQMHEGLANVQERGIFIAESNALQYEIYGAVVATLVVILCCLRSFTPFFQKHRKIGFALTGIFAAISIACYILILAI
ncbi:MAG: hypothetical protein PUC66_00920 [Erysipelotrichaceae bacterium]|nr:hypothetical protein [Erysipelotrichaceae bacterium]